MVLPPHRAAADHLRVWQGGARGQGHLPADRGVVVGAAGHEVGQVLHQVLVRLRAEGHRVDGATVVGDVVLDVGDRWVHVLLAVGQDGVGADVVVHALRGELGAGGEHAGPDGGAARRGLPGDGSLQRRALAGVDLIQPHFHRCGVGEG